MKTLTEKIYSEIKKETKNVLISEMFMYDENDKDYKSTNYYNKLAIVVKELPKMDLSSFIITKSRYEKGDDIFIIFCGDYVKQEGIDYNNPYRTIKEIPTVTIETKEYKVIAGNLNCEHITKAYDLTSAKFSAARAYFNVKSIELCE